MLHVVLLRPLARSTMKLMKQTPFVLLLLTISSLLFVTLLELAVSHIRKKTGLSDKGSEGLNSGREADKKSQKIEAVRLEAVFDKNAPTVDVNIKILRRCVNIVRIKQILQIMGDKSNTGSYNRTLSENGTELFSERYQSCPEVPPTLVGRLKVELKASFDMESIIKRNPDVKLGGIYSPSYCKSRHRVAIIVPYRDRLEHLSSLLSYLHPMLQRQLIEYRIYVVEQYGNDTFNKGVLMNAGVKEALRQSDFNCFVFHDVDLVPEDDRNMYSCPPYPRHMSVAVDKFNYTLPYGLLVGGVLSIKTDHLLQVNGYSNLYWGWGGEDDDMAYRITYKMNVIRPPDELGRYTMIKHDHRAESPSNIRYALLRMAKRRSSKDGLNTVKYSVVAKTPLQLYTHILVDIGLNHRWQYDGGKRLIVHF